MGSFYPTQDSAAAWQATSIAASAVANSGNAETAALSNNSKLGTEVSIAAAYGATATVGLKVYVLREVDTTTYEAVADKPYGFEMPFTVSTTHRRGFWVPHSFGAFKIRVENASGASVTVTVKTRQQTGVTA